MYAIYASCSAKLGKTLALWYDDHKTRAVFFRARFMHAARQNLLTWILVNVLEDHFQIL